MVWGYRAAALGLWFADNLDIHQAYLEYDFGAAALRVGRQKFNLADQRLVASRTTWPVAMRIRTAAAPRRQRCRQRLDLTASMPLIAEGLTLVVGVSRFFGGHYLRDTGPDGDASFFFLQLSYTP